MRLGDVVYFMFILIVIYLLVRNWQGANALLATGFGGTGKLVQTLQGR